MTRENEIFNKMIRHYVKSVSAQVKEEKEEQHSFYELAKHELWALYAEKEDAKHD